MNKRILISLSVIGAVAAIAIGGTIAYFSDTETSTGNTFTAGSIDLKVDSACKYNGVTQPYCTWAEKDLTANDLFFNLGDVKPGDDGEVTLSLHVIDNDACGFVKITKVLDTDNTCTEPELGAEPGCLPAGDGELDENVIFSIWADTCAVSPAVPGDNIYQVGCDTPLTTGTLDAVENWGIGKLIGGATTFYGMSWTLPSTVGNNVQSDKFTADLEFRAEQFRNQYDAGSTHPNGCPVGEIVQPAIIEVISNMMNFSSTGWAGWSCPGTHPNIVSGATNCLLSLTNSLAWQVGASVGAYNYPTTPFGYTYTSPTEEGWIVQNGGTGQSCNIILQCQAN